MLSTSQVIEVDCFGRLDVFAVDDFCERRLEDLEERRTVGTGSGVGISSVIVFT